MFTIEVLRLANPRFKNTAIEHNLLHLPWHWQGGSSPGRMREDLNAPPISAASGAPGFSTPHIVCGPGMRSGPPVLTLDDKTNTIVA